MDSENTDLIEIDHDIKGMENSILRKNNEHNLWIKRNEAALFTLYFSDLCK